MLELTCAVCYEACSDQRCFWLCIWWLVIWSQDTYERNITSFHDIPYLWRKWRAWMLSVQLVLTRHLQLWNGFGAGCDIVIAVCMSYYVKHIHSLPYHSSLMHSCACT